MSEDQEKINQQPQSSDQATDGNTTNNHNNLRKNSNSPGNEASSINQNSSLDILSNGAKSINKNFLLEYSKLNNKSIDKEAIKNCKILKFSSEWNCNQVQRKITRLDPKVFENLFIFVIELENDVEPEKSLDILKKCLILFDENRPLVLQVISKKENTTKVFYKEQNLSSFVEFKQRLEQPESFNDFQTIFWLFKHKNGKEFENVLQNLNLCKISLLVLRILRILEFSDEFFQNLVLKCGSKGSRNELLAVLDAPFGYESGPIISKPMKILSEEFNKESVLLNAVQASNTEVIDFIIKNCHYVIKYHKHEHKIKISTAAYEKDNKSLLCDLIELCDFPFPKDFNQDDVTDERLEEIIKKRTEFHKAIENENQKRIIEFIEAHPMIKNAFNANNDSAVYKALNASLKSKKYDIFWLMRSKGYIAVEYDDLKQVFNDKEEFKIMEKLGIEKRKEIVKNILKNKNNSTTLLSMRSFIHNKKISEVTQQEYHDKIKSWYEDIYATNFSDLNYLNEFIRHLINIAATCPDLRIIFDFESETIENIDMIERAPDAVTYSCSKWIIIGAKTTSLTENRERQIKSIIAHEICHYVMKMVYQNDELPYFKEDEETAKTFRKIVKKIQSKCEKIGDDFFDECDGIISNVFNNYTSGMFQIEMAVRVAEILVRFSDNESKVKALSEKYNEIFEFVKNNTIPDFIKFLTFEHEKVREFNKVVGFLPAIKEVEYNFKRVQNTSQLTVNRLTVVKTNQPKLLFVKIYKDLLKKYGVLVDTKNVFVNFKAFNDLTDFEDILTRNTNLNIFVDCSEDIIENLKHIQHNPGNKFVFIVSYGRNNENITRIIETSQQSINIDWKNLEDSSQEALLQSKIFMRNGKSTFHDLLLKVDKKQPKTKTENLKIISGLVDDEMLSLMLNNSIISINSDFGAIKEDEDNFQGSFMIRNFIEIKQVLNEEQKNFIKTKTENISESEVLDRVIDNKYVLLSDIAGSGKSWAMQNFIEIFDKKYPTFWISRIELKEYIKIFKAEQGTEPEFANFMTEKILRQKSKAETEFFSKMYKIGKLFIVFDGFDEIAPDYEEFVVKLIKSFESNNGNQLWVLTRDYFEVDLQGKLKIDTVYKLQPFNKQNGVDLITSNWILRDLGEKVYKKSREELKKLIKDDKNFKKYQKRAEKLNEKIVNIKTSPIGVPQFYKIVAIVMKNLDLQEGLITIFIIYGKYMEHQYERWSYEKGELRKEANIKNQFSYTLGFNEMHIFLAICRIYSGKDYFCDLEFNLDTWNQQEMIACGLLKKIDDDFFFINETFGEYFAAQFIVRYLMRGGKRDDEDFCKFFIDFLFIPKYGIIRMFLDEAFAEKLILKKTEQKIPKIVDFFFKNVSKFNSVTEIFEKSQKNLVDLLKKFFKTGKYEDTKEILFNSVNTMTEAAERNESCIKFLEFTCSILNVKDFEHLLTKIEVNKRNFILNLVKLNKSEDIEKTFEIIRKKFSNDEYQELLSSKHFNDKNLLQKASAMPINIKTYQVIWKIYQHFYESKEEFLKQLKVVDKFNENVFHNAASSSTAEIFEFIIKEVKGITSKEEVKEILNTLGHLNRNILQTAAYHNESLELLSSLWKIVKNHFEPSEIHEMLQHTDKNDQNILYLAYYWNKKYILEFVFEQMLGSEEIITKHEILQLLLHLDSFKCNSLFKNPINCDIEKFEYCWDKFINILRDEDSMHKFKELLIFDNGYTILHKSAICCDNIDYYKSLIQQLLKYFDNLENLFNLMLENGPSHNNLLHLLAKSIKIDFIEKTFEIIEDKFSNIQLQQVLKAKNENERNLLQFAAFRSKDIKVHHDLWKLFKKFFKSKDELFEILQEVDKNNNNILHIAAGHSSSEIFEFMINELENFASHEEVKNFLSSKGNNNGNILHIATKNNKSLELHQKLWDIIEKYYGFSEIKELIIHQNSSRNTILHMAVYWNVKEIAEFTWEKIKKFISIKEDQIKYLRLKGCKEQTLIEMSLHNQSQEMENWVKNLEFSDENWIRFSSDQCNLPENLVKVGNDADGSCIYVGRAYHCGDLLPAKVIPSSKFCSVSYDGSEISKYDDFEYLVGTKFSWIESSYGNYPDNAVISGTTNYGEPLAVGRANHEGYLILGKVHKSHGCLFLPFGGAEHRALNYEVLVKMNK